MQNPMDHLCNTDIRIWSDGKSPQESNGEVRICIAIMPDKNSAQTCAPYCHTETKCNSHFYLLPSTANRIANFEKFLPPKKNKRCAVKRRSSSAIVCLRESTSSRFY